MKLSQSNYYEIFNKGQETLHIEVNEESKQIRLKFFQEKWRNVKERKYIINYLKDFVDNIENNLEINK